MAEPAGRIRQEPLVLVVTDDPSLLALLSAWLLHLPARVDPATSCERAAKHALHERPELAIVDDRLPRAARAELLSILRFRPGATASRTLDVSDLGDSALDDSRPMGDRLRRERVLEVVAAALSPAPRASAEPAC